MCRVRKANLNDMISDHGLDVVKIPGTEVSKVVINVNRTAICLSRKKGFMVQRQPATPPAALNGKLQRVTLGVRLSSILLLGSGNGQCIFVFISEYEDP
jgi:hypothetical protein